MAVKHLADLQTRFDRVLDTRLSCLALHLIEVMNDEISSRYRSTTSRTPLIRLRAHSTPADELSVQNCGNWQAALWILARLLLQLLNGSGEMPLLHFTTPIFWSGNL